MKTLYWNELIDYVDGCLDFSWISWEILAIVIWVLITLNENVFN